MLVVCPYTEIRDETRAALDQSGYEWEPRFVGGSDTDYFDLLSELWRAGADFVIVEHDVVIAPSTLDIFDACPSEWCGSGYPYMRMAAYVGLGCVRFRGELTRALPDLMDRVATLDYANHGHRHYCTLDAQIQNTLHSAGRFVCEHPPVEHLGLWPSHGCVPAPQG